MTKLIFFKVIEVMTPERVLPVCVRRTWEALEVRLAVLGSIRVVPEVRRLTGEGFGAHQLTSLSLDTLTCNRHSIQHYNTNNTDERSFLLSITTDY